MDDSLRAAILENLLFAGMPRKGLPPRLLLRATRDELVASGLPPDLADQLVSLRNSKEEFAEALRTTRARAHMMVRTMSNYPSDLESHPYAPRLIYRRGLPLPCRPRVGLVGARAASSNMIDFASRLGYDAARAGICVVSGLARGIDAAAHRGALDAGGSCVGVLGCGIDVVYPRDTKSVRERVEATGTVLTTFPFGTAPLQRHFPTRNRLLAALCDVVVVVQARIDSGSMSTARAALDAGIEVMAVPGAPRDPLCEGTNCLIRDGARPVLESRDILEAIYGVGAPQTFPETDKTSRVSHPPNADRLTRSILDQIGSVARSADDLARILQLSTGTVLARLTELEVEGHVVRETGGVFRRRNP